jgi:hypothetical protein
MRATLKSDIRSSAGKVRFGSVLQEILKNLELNFRFGRGGMLEPEPELPGSGSGAFDSGSRGFERGTELYHRCKKNVGRIWD